eukprot:9544133-Alexandrium_andersonii.AAC.1
MLGCLMPPPTLAAQQATRTPAPPHAQSTCEARRAHRAPTLRGATLARQSAANSFRCAPDHRADRGAEAVQKSRRRRKRAPRT